MDVAALAEFVWFGVDSHSFDCAGVAGTRVGRGVFAGRGVATIYAGECGRALAAANSGVSVGIVCGVFDLPAAHARFSRSLQRKTQPQNH